MRARVLLIVGSILAGLAVASPSAGPRPSRIAQLPAWPFAAGLAMIVLGWLVDAERLRLLARGLGPRLTRRETIQLVMATEFCSYAATPAGAGGPLTAIYLLTRHRIPAARAAALCTVDQLLDLVLFLTLLPLLAALLLGGYAPIQLQYQLLLRADAGRGIGIGCPGAVEIPPCPVVHRPDTARAAHPARTPCASRRAPSCASVTVSRLILALPRRRLLAVYALCAAHWLLRYSVLFVLIKGAGADVAWSTLILVQMLALTAGQLSLLPGGSGTVDFVLGAMMSRWLDPATAVAVMLEWRFVLYYWYLLAGAPFFVAQILRRKQTVLELTRTA